MAPNREGGKQNGVKILPVISDLTLITLRQ